MANAYAADNAPKDKEDVLREGKKRLDIAWNYDKDNRDEAIKDLKFLSLDQWPESIRQQRNREGRPCLTLDHLNQHKNQVVNDIRQAKIGIKAVGVDDKTDPHLAEIYSSLMRDIQYQSSAQHVFAAAANGAVSCGIGHFRFKRQYMPGSFDQELKVALIPYPLAVYWDPASIEPDRSDAMWCFVVEFIPTDSFESRYPKARKVDIDVPKDNDAGLYWATNDGVLVAEYWCKKPSKRRLAAFEDGSVLDITDLSAKELSFLPPVAKDGKGNPREREDDGFKVEQSLLTGAEVLDGPNEEPGQYIPIVPVIGSEIHLERTTVRMSLIRGGRDAQQLYNYSRTAAAELIAQSPKSKWLATATQIGEYKPEWDKANLDPKPYLRYKPDPAAGGPPTRIPPPEPPAAIWQEAQLAVDDIKAATGIYDASLGARSNEQSGVAIERRQREGDVSTYHFSDNLERSLQHAGRVMIDLIPKVYDNQRVVRLMNEDDEHDFEPINTMIMGVDGEPQMLNDLSQGRYDVRVSIGPSFTTQRLEAVDSMIAYFKADPEALPVARDIFVKNMDWPGAAEIAERFKRTIPPQVLGPDEQPEQQQPTPDPMQAELAKVQAEAQIEQQKLQSNAEIARQKLVSEQQIKREQMQVELQVAREKAELEMAIARQKAEAQLAIDVMRLEKESEARVAMKQQETGAMGEMVRVLAAPKRVIRDENDRIEMVEPVVGG
jgi:hypothetical protein